MMLLVLVMLVLLHLCVLLAGNGAGGYPRRTLGWEHRHPCRTHAPKLSSELLLELLLLLRV
jgi:hypothetical protein